MKKSKFAEEHIVFALKEPQQGTKVKVDVMTIFERRNTLILVAPSFDGQQLSLSMAVANRLGLSWSRVIGKIPASVGMHNLPNLLRSLFQPEVHQLYYIQFIFQH